MIFKDLSEYSLQEIRDNFISPGFRNCVYMQEPRTKVGYIYFLGFNKKNEPFNFRYRWQCSMGYALKDKDKSCPSDIFGRSIKYKYFDSIKARKDYITENKQIFNIVDVRSPEQEFLIELFWDVADEPDFNQQPVRVHWIDIETEISDRFEYAYTARNRINILTIYDSATKFFYTWSLHKVPDDDLILDDRHIVYDDFDNDEEAMLKDYLNWHVKNYPDVIQGWNSVDYDIPYLLRRFENVLGEERAKQFSPFHRYWIKEEQELENPNNPDSRKIKASITGISHLDELLLYRDKFQVRLQADGGFGLNNIGIIEGLGKKQEYEGSLKNLYETNWGLFYKYNVQDVKLLVDIENKCRLIDLSRQIAGSGCMNYEAIYTSISYVIGSLYCYSKKHMNGKIVPTYVDLDNSHYEPYEGAFVFDIEPSFYKGGIICIDFNSLYPSTIRANNISPETYVGKVISIDGGYINDPINWKEISDDSRIQLRNINRQIIEISGKKLKELVRTKVIFTTNNTMFLKPSIKKGLLNCWSEDNFNKRKIFKKKKFEAHKAHDAVMEQRYNNTQMSIKNFLNTVYGVTGTRFSPIGNSDIAQTITRQGKLCNTSANKQIGELFKQKYGVKDNYKLTAGGDTDSCVFSTLVDIIVG